MPDESHGRMEVKITLSPRAEKLLDELISLEEDLCDVCKGHLVMALEKLYPLFEPEKPDEPPRNDP